MSDIYVNRDNGDYYAKIDGAWILKGNLHVIARNSQRPNAEVVSLSEKREERRLRNVT